MIGVFITIYVVLIELNVYSIQTHKNELENCFSRVMQQTLEEGYSTKDDAGAVQMLKQELADCLSHEENLNIAITCMDLQKGILSAVVTEDISLITGKKKSISVEKTVFMDRKAVNEPQVTVEFWVDSELYKKYTLVKGEICPMPKLPEGVLGWVEDGRESEETIASIGAVYEDKIYAASKTK